MVGHLYRSVNQSQANKPRQRQQTPAGRATLRERTKVEHAFAPVGHWQGRRACYRGNRKNPFDLRAPWSTTSTSSPASPPPTTTSWLSDDYLTGALNSLSRRPTR
jgi:hypothetical protein